MSDYTEKISEIDGRIILQAQLLMPQDLQEQSSMFPLLVMDVQHKLHALLYHLENFTNVEDVVIKRCLEKPKEEVRIPSNLYFEFEAFLFQIKSTLDITVKILKQLFPGSFHIGTFRNKGQKLILNLERYRDNMIKDLEKSIINKKQLDFAIKYRSETIDRIISMLEDDRSTWLSKVIAARDTISHYKGSKNLDGYTVAQVGEEIQIIVPKILDVYPRRFLEVTYQNCIEFIQDFICLFIELWLPPMFRIIAASDDDLLLTKWRESKFPAAQYIKYSLGSREWT